MIKIEFGEQEKTIRESHLAYYCEYVLRNVLDAINKPEQMKKFTKNEDIINEHLQFLQYVVSHISIFAVGTVAELDELHEHIKKNFSNVYQLIKGTGETKQESDAEKEKQKKYSSYLQQLFGYSEFSKKGSSLSLFENLKAMAKTATGSNRYDDKVYDKMIEILCHLFPKQKDKLCNLLECEKEKEHDEQNSEGKRTVNRLTEPKFKKLFDEFHELYITYMNIHYSINSYQIKNLLSKEWNPYYFVLLSGIRVCPYCNAQYITPVFSPTGKMRADLDHFYPKGQYPYFSMSLFNLIPVCKSCNSSLKGEKELSSKVHPYKASVNDLFSFRIHLQTKQLQILQHHEVVRDYLELFKIEATASYHAGQVEELLFKQRAYPKSYLKELAAQTRMTVRYVKTQAIGYVQDEKSLNDSTFAKLRRDVAKQLNFIEPIDDDTKAKLRKLAKQLGHE